MLCAGAGIGDVTAVIRDPQGRENTVEAMMEDTGDSVYRCTYRPTQAGTHTVTVTFGGVGVPKSPFVVDVGPGRLCSIIVPVSYTTRHVHVVSLCLPLQPASRGRAGRRGVGSSRRV